MRTLTITLVLLTLTQVSQAEEKWGIHTAVPQSLGPHNLMTAVKTGDTALLQKVWTETYHQKFAKEGWDNILKRYQQAIQISDEKDWDVNKLEYRYTAKDETSGVLQVRYAGEVKGRLRVKLEKKQWLMNER